MTSTFSRDLSYDARYVLVRPACKSLTIEHYTACFTTGFRECGESRPPLQTAGAEGPNPCAYTVPQPTRCTLGGKINPKTKYDRGMKFPSAYHYTCINLFAKDALPRPNYEVWTLNVCTLEKVILTLHHAELSTIIIWQFSFLRHLLPVLMLWSMELVGRAHQRRLDQLTP